MISGQSECEWLFAKIVSQTGDKFSWLERLPVEGGDFIEGTRCGSEEDDPAFELNSETPAAFGFLAVVVRDPQTGRLTFSLPR